MWEWLQEPERSQRRSLVFSGEGVSVARRSGQGSPSGPGLALASHSLDQKSLVPVECAVAASAPSSTGERGRQISPIKVQDGVLV